MTIRRFEKTDAAEVSRLIRTTIQISNAKDYPAELLDALVETETEEHVLERAGWTHFYVVTDEDRIIGCGAIGPYWGKEDESSLFTIFVHPDYQGKGIGRDIIHTLEQDEYFQRAQRIEIPASITGVPFYRKMGYEYKNGVTEPDEEHLIRMEKKRELWDLYDREGKRTGEIFERGFGTYQNIPQGRFHLVSDILVRNKDGRYLLCKRHMGKDVYPGFWEASAGGSAKVGELPEECARRELKEETGLEADQLELINVVFREPSHSLIYCYVADVDADPDSVILQEGETVDYKWVDAVGLIEYSTSDVAIKTSVERYANFYNALKIREMDTKVLGLNRGTVSVELHDPEWERIAKDTIEKLKRLLSGVALDIQHIGSTAIKNIVAKPIIDIVVGVSDFDRIFKLNPVLEENGFIFRGQDVPNQYLYVCGDADSRTHHIHVVLCYSVYWNNYVNMRDYLNTHKEDAREYSELKKRLAAEYPEDRNTYTEKKSALINEILKKAAAWRNSLNHSLLKSTQNTRTLLTGSYRYIRSDVPGSLTDDEVRWLYQNGITTIVDLRSEGEFLRKPCRLEHEVGFTYYHMPVTGDGAVPDSPEEVPASYVSMIDDQMERIIHTIMNADSNVLYFCNAGKDRTGVVSAIILYRMGFDDQTIIADYMKTKENLMDLLEAYVREHPEVDHFTVIPKKDNIMAVLAYLKSENTGVNS